MGHQLLYDSVDNVHGHFEDLDFYHFHQRLLKKRGLKESGLSSNKNILDFTKRERNLAEKLVEEKEKANINQPWGWKDPRTVLFIYAWLKIIRSPEIICVYRDYNQVCDSLYRRAQKKNSIRRFPVNQILKGGLKIKKRSFINSVLNDWINYNTIIFELVKENSASLFYYQDILDKPDRFLNYLGITPINLQNLRKDEIRLNTPRLISKKKNKVAGKLLDSLHAYKVTL